MPPLPLLPCRDDLLKLAFRGDVRPFGGAPCAVPALCEKAAVFHHR